MTREEADHRYGGVLTPDDREALRDGDELDPAAFRQTRYRIRERVKRAIRDLSFLQRQLPRRDRRLIFEEFMTDDESQRLRELAGFLFYGLYETAEEYRTPQGRALDGPVEVVEDLVSAGVYSAEWNRAGCQPDVTAEISVDRWWPDPEAARDRLARGVGTHDELVYLARWCDDTRLLERVVETGEPLRLVAGSAARFGDDCLVELTPEDAASWLEHFDGGADADGEVA